MASTAFRASGIAPGSTAIRLEAFAHQATEFARLQGLLTPSAQQGKHSRTPPGARAFADVERKKKAMAWSPLAESVAILDRAQEHVQGLPHRALLRWLLYRLLQDGLYTVKTKYHNFVCPMSDAHKGGWKEWQPDSLADGTINIVQRGAGLKTGAPWVADLPTLVVDAVKRAVVVSHYFKQKEYFGDRDDKSDQIIRDIVDDIRSWCSVPLTFAPCGLALEQVKASVSSYIDVELIKRDEKSREPYRKKWSEIARKAIVKAVLA